MNIIVQSAEGQSLPLASGEDVVIGSAADCALRPQLPGLAPKLAVLTSSHGEAWLQVRQPEALVCVNARPIRELARLHPGDRVCIQTWHLDLLGRSPEPWPDVADVVDVAAPASGSGDPGPAPADVFALRCLNGSEHGRLHAGPAISLAASGEVVAGTDPVELALCGRQLRLDPGSAEVMVNGHPVRNRVRLGHGDQLRVGACRYRIEIWQQGTDPLPALAGPATDTLPDPLATQNPGAAVRPGGSLMWLIIVAALLAAALTGLLTWRSGL